MASRYETFLSLKQEPRRLAIALEEYGLDEAHRAEYGQYLQKRIRPAAAALIQAEDLDRLEAVQQWFTAPLVDEFLQTAAEAKKTAAFVWLLRYKQQHFGFPGQDFSL